MVPKLDSCGNMLSVETAKFQSTSTNTFNMLSSLIVF